MTENKTPLRIQSERFKLVHRALSSLINKMGFKAWIVGGFVRDLLLNKKAEDIDIVVDVKSILIFFDALKKIGLKSITFDKKDNENNVKFEVLKFRLTIDGLGYEDIDVAIPRKETYSKDSRKPSEVEFAKGGIKEDAKRRDLTINALYLKLGEENNIDELFKKDGSINEYMVEKFVDDPTGEGLNNLWGYDEGCWVGEPVIKLTNKPEILFEDDPLRILRVYRFLTKGFVFGAGVEEALHESSKYFLVGTKISHDRIRDEFSKILLKSSSEDGFQLMEILEKMREDGILELFLPKVSRMWGYDQNNSHHTMDLWGHTMAVLRYLKKSEKYNLSSNYIEKAGMEEDVISLKEICLSTNGFPLYLCVLLAGLLHDVAKPETRSTDEKGESHYYSHEKVSGEMAVEILNELKYTKDIQQLVKAIIERHMLLKDFRKSLTGRDDKKLKNLREKFIFEIHGKKVDIQNICLLLMEADDSSKGIKDISEMKELRADIAAFKEEWENYLERVKLLPPPPKFKIEGEVVANHYNLLLPSIQLGKRIKELKDFSNEVETSSLEELMDIYDHQQNNYQFC